jgi:hypothetical protein
MTKHLRSLLTIAVVSALTATAAPAALGTETCPNEQLRIENNSTALPDCRAYELVSPDSNHSVMATSVGLAPTDGQKMLYVLNDAPDNASSGEAVSNMVRATRDPLTGWSGVSLSPPVIGPITGYLSYRTWAVSSDLSTAYEVGTQLLTPDATNGFNAFIIRPGGVAELLTPFGPPGNNSAFVAGDADFSRVYFQPAVAQLPSDPTGGGNTYSWWEGRGPRLVGILPGGTPAPSGATLVGSIIGPISEDGSRAVFMTEGKLYMRVEDEERTVEATASQRTINPDPNPGPSLAHVAEGNALFLGGTNAAGSKVMFVAHSELTNDANTGSSGGVATDAGADLYSYDVASDHLTDLTVDTDSADAATGAGVQQVLGATPDGSYIYFTATGHLAPGAQPGHTSLYVWHGGEVDFVANASGLSGVSLGLGVPRLPVTPDGRHVVFASTDSLTGYDNTDPATGRPHAELFLATLGSGLQCVSCRVNGTRPTADSTLPAGQTPAISDDGRRVLFESSDAVVPQASSGLQQVFEYQEGTVSPLSSLTGTSPATILAASPTGDDVFFLTFDSLVASPTAGDEAVYDARVDGGFPVISRRECSGDACHAPPISPPAIGAPATSSFSGAGNLAVPAPTTTTKPQPGALTRSQKLARALRACKSKHDKKKRSTCEKSARKKYGRKK